MNQKIICYRKKLVIFVPDRMRIGLEGELTVLIQRKIEAFQISIRKAIVTLCDDNEKCVIALHLCVDLKTMERSDNSLTEIRCRDRVIGTVYVSRTEFNNQEAVFALYPDVFPYIRRNWNDMKKHL